MNQTGCSSLDIVVLFVCLLDIVSWRRNQLLCLCFLLPSSISWYGSIADFWTTDLNWAGTLTCEFFFFSKHYTDPWLVKWEHSELWLCRVYYKLIHRFLTALGGVSTQVCMLSMGQLYYSLIIYLWREILTVCWFCLFAATNIHTQVFVWI